MLATDMQASGFRPGPMPVGVFPVPSYGLLGEDSFHGVGFHCGDRPFGGRGNHLIYTSFFVNRNKFNTQYIPADKPGEAFFTIVVLSDAVIDTVDYSHCRNGITSRNNPDFVGQGSIRTEASDIDYIAFQTADRSNYALVNMRLFDLAHGRIVLIAPYRDGSFQSLQLASYAIYSLADVESVIDRVLSDKSALRFLETAGRQAGRSKS